jgi:hypothetical protein
VWGDSGSGGTDAPAGSGYTKIYSNWQAFAVIKTDGSIAAWGDPDAGGTSPAGSGYTRIYSTDSAFAALKADEPESPHTLIDPSALRAAKALAVE